MTKILTIIMAALAFLAVGTFDAGAKSSSVKGYTKKNGTYVAPHQRSSPNKSKGDNWSSKGNVNPYTGKRGTKKD